MSLNVNQERAVSVALRSLEERLARVEGLLDRDEEGLLYRRRRPVWAREERARAEAILADLRSTIASISRAFNLAPEERDSAREIAGLMTISWESLAEVGSRRLRAYGRVDPALRDTLDPALERLIELVSALEDLALGDDGPASGPADAIPSPDGPPLPSIVHPTVDRTPGIPAVGATEPPE
ncbi:MAG: hypothetical protein ABSG37_03270 [Candidatus Limnocylindrales bacterium]